jgi:hypothetical protein
MCAVEKLNTTLPFPLLVLVLVDIALGLGCNF